jgi:hypothetical protein
LIKQQKLKLFQTGSYNDVTMWYWDEKPVCDVCKREIHDNSGFFIVDWTKEGRFDSLLHLGCVPRWVKHPLSVTQSRWDVLFTHVIPPRSVPVIIPTPSFSPVRGEVSVFEPSKLPSDKTTDRAWRSKRAEYQLEGATVGDPLIEHKIAEKDRAIEDDPFAFLLEQKKLGEKAQLEHKERRLIGDDDKTRV